MCPLFHLLGEQVSRRATVWWATVRTHTGVIMKLLALGLLLLQRLFDHISPSSHPH